VLVTVHGCRGRELRYVLADPGVTYPVTVDPDMSFITTFDTWVQVDFPGERSAALDLRVGTDSSGKPARSFLNWNVAKLRGAKIVEAHLNLFNSYSATCANRAVDIHSANPLNLNRPPRNWAEQPAMVAAKAGSTSGSKAGPACAEKGYISGSITQLVQNWANGGPTTVGLALKAPSETDVKFYKRFHSANQTSGRPQLYVTYNNEPAVGTDLKAGPPLLSYGGVFAVNSTTPTLQYKAADANGDKLQGTFELQDASGTPAGAPLVVSNVPAGQVASVKVPAGRLTHGNTYRFRVRSFDGRHYSHAWSPFTSFTVDTARPSAPTEVSSTDYPSGQWVKGAGQPGTFTATPPAGDDHNWIEWSLDGITWAKVATAGAPGPKSFSVTPPKNGSHTLQVRAMDRAGNTSEPAEYTFHAGPGGFDSPGDGQRTARRVPLVAEGDGSRYNAVRFSWRRSDADPWAPIPPGQVTKDGDPLTAWPIPLDGGRNAPVTWNATDTVNPDGTVQVRAEFSGAATGATDPISIVVDRNADGAAAEEIGPGSVNLLTGDFTLSGGDASFFGMSASRTASSRQPQAGAAQEGQAPIFGKEWVSGVAAEELEESDYSHLRKTSDTSLDVVLEDGSALHFTANKAQTGWVPEPGAEDLTLTGAFTGSFALADSEGTVTTFTKVAPAAATWQVTSSLVNGLDNSTTKVVSEAVTVAGKTLARPKRIIAPTSAATLAACEANPATRGCRVLEFGYATITTATGSALGDVAGQLTEIRLWSTSPGAAASTATPVSKYAYDAGGRLREVWDPRLSPPLKTAYDYDAAGRVTTLTPAGEMPWTFTYGKAGDAATAGEGMLLKASRPALRPGTLDEVDGTAATSIVYGVPLTGAKAPAAMSAADVRAWGQTDAPTDAAAVFPADAAPPSHTGAGLGSGDYRRASLTYLDASGRAVNTVAPGGHVTTTEFDKFGNAVRELTAANRTLALGDTDAEKATLTELGIVGLPPAQRADLLSTVSVYDADGTRELEELGPLHEITLTAGGTATARARTLNEYDVGRPTNGTAVVKDQATKVTVGAQLRERPDTLADPRVTTNTVDWVKGVTTATTQDPGGLAITRRTEYDAQGRITKTLLPGSSGSDAAATVTTYYTAGGTGPCGGRPEWADQVCTTGPAGAVTGGGDNPSELPTKRTEYDRYGAESAEIETANGVTRTTTTASDAAGRPTTVTVSGGVGAEVPAVITEYDPATGQAVRTVSPTGGTISRVFDKLGRQIRYTDADGGTTTTELDKLDRPMKVSDSVPSTVSYTYDHAAEPRGLATAMTDSVAGTFAATYDADGSVAQEKLPGGYTMRQADDPTGSPVTRTYSRDSDGAVLLADSISESVHSQWMTHTGGAGQASTNAYRYDAVGRLVGVDDTLGDACTRRGYGFDSHSNRLSMTAAAGESEAPCPAGGGETVTHRYDSADRIVDDGYGYDAFGRTTASPGGVTTAYYATDLAHQQTANGKRQTWTLDAAHRFRSWTVETTVDGNWQVTGAKRNHYDGDGDNPRWIVENGDGALSRNVDSLAGDLGATTAKSGDVTLHFTNLHGDVNLALPLDGDRAPTVLDADEYGNARDGQDPTRYGWLGGKQRSAETPTGMTLMGVRLYNPASGRFLQTDPVEGGNHNAYEYCGADPVNCFDLDGRWGWIKKKFKKFNSWRHSAGRNMYWRAGYHTARAGFATWTFGGPWKFAKIGKHAKNPLSWRGKLKRLSISCKGGRKAWASCGGLWDSVRGVGKHWRNAGRAWRDIGAYHTRTLWRESWRWQRSGGSGREWWRRLRWGG